MGLSWGTKATLKWVQKRVPDSQPLPSLAVNFFLTMMALWRTHSPGREEKEKVLCVGQVGDLGLVHTCLCVCECVFMGASAEDA